MITNLNVNSRYIEFYDVMSVPMAIALSGQLLLGQPVMVKPSEAEKNLVQSTTAAGGAGLTGANSGAARKLYVGNLHLNITEPQLRQVCFQLSIAKLYLSSSLCSGREAYAGNLLVYCIDYICSFSFW